MWVKAGNSIDFVFNTLKDSQLAKEAKSIHDARQPMMSGVSHA
jgi:hypothetical protein